MHVKVILILLIYHNPEIDDETFPLISCILPRYIIFNNKMNTTVPVPGSVPLLSPKESQERELRALALQKIDSEI